MKSSVDFFGTSFYPKLTSVDRNWTLERRVLAMDLTYAITGDGGFYVGELQSGFGVHGTIVGSPVTPSDLQLWTWGMVSRGARAISYYAFYPMNAGYESGGYGMINMDGTLTERSRQAGETAALITRNADLLLQARPEHAEAAVIFNPIMPLLGGYDEQGSRNAIHQAVAGYHRMFFERNLPLDILSSRELSRDKLSQYKLVIVPYPLMLTSDEALSLKQYVAEGGHLFVEARPGWVDERGHAEPRIPGFGLDEILGVRERELIPGKEFQIKWDSYEFKAMTFLERFDVTNSQAHAVAYDTDRTPVAFENHFGKGSAIVLGSFAGQENYRDPQDRHPLGDILAKWANLAAPKLRPSTLVELRQMYAPSGRLVFFFNHAKKPVMVDFMLTLEKPAASVHEIVTSRAEPATGKTFSIQTEVPAESVRIYRIDF